MLTSSTAVRPPKRTVTWSRLQHVGKVLGVHRSFEAPTRHQGRLGHRDHLRQAPIEPREQRVTRRVADLHEPAREVHQQDEQPDAARQRRHQRARRPERGKADHPERAEHGAGDGPDAADDRDRHDLQRVFDGEDFADTDRREQPAEERAAEAGEGAGEGERLELRPGRRDGVGRRGFGVVAHARSWRVRSRTGGGVRRAASRRPVR